MTAGRPRNPLTPEERTFLTLYTEKYKFDTVAAIKEAGIVHLNKQSAAQKAQFILNKPESQKFIQELIDKKRIRFSISEEEILKGIYSEAQYFGEGASHAARINAWVQLGKHFGMFSDKKQEATNTPSITYNVINYNEGILDAKIEKEIKATAQEILNKEPVQTYMLEDSIDIEIEDY
jgi:hypothetical protein